MQGVQMTRNCRVTKLNDRFDAMIRRPNEGLWLEQQWTAGLNQVNNSAWRGQITVDRVRLLLRGLSLGTSQ